MSLALLGLMGFVPLPISDPAPGLTRSKKNARNLECTRLSVESGVAARPGQIQPRKPRGDYAERDVMLCAERLIPRDLRPARDDLILSTLEIRVEEIAMDATSHRTDLDDKTWLVETYYPSAVVSTKIAFATKNALMGHGVTVSDRVPVLSAADVGVITRMDPSEAYPLACVRYYANGTLTDDDVLLGVVSRDRRETILHAGVCERGQWAWIR